MQVKIQIEIQLVSQKEIVGRHLILQAANKMLMIKDLIFSLIILTKLYNIALVTMQFLEGVQLLLLRILTQLLLFPTILTFIVLPQDQETLTHSS